MVASRVRIDSIAAGGDGVGRTDGMVVFTPRTAPGDLVDVTLDVRGRFARGRVVDLIESSGERVSPPCMHYTGDRCGGCQVQHLAYHAQLAAKGAIVHDAMARIGGRQVGNVDVHPSPAEWEYRNKLTLALRWRGDRWIAGLHPYDDPDAVFDLRECLITDPRIVAIWREIVNAPDALPKARRLRGAVRLTPNGGSFVLEGGTQWRGAARLAERIPALTSIWWQPPGAKRRLVVDRRSEGGDADARRGPVPTPDASFAQVNPGAARLLHERVIAATMTRSPATVVDAYAGSGATAIPLAARGPRVTAIELDTAAAHWLADHLPEGSRSIAARVEDVLAESLPADVVILNPPRTGVDERVTEVLRRPGMAKAVVYVSCNPATLARDVRRLDTFRVAALTAFDLFPQTAHVETVCELVPEAA